MEPRGAQRKIGDEAVKSPHNLLTLTAVAIFLFRSYEKDAYGLHKFLESGKIQVSGLVVSDYSFKYSHFEAVRSLDEWMKSEGEGMTMCRSRGHPS